MNQTKEYEQLVKLMDQYERSLKECSIKDFRELRYQLKQVIEKMRSCKQPGKGEITS